MWTQLKFEFHPALSSVIVLLWILISTKVYRISAMLVERYPMLWFQLGCPKVPKYFVGIDVLVRFSVMRPGLARWITSGEFKKLKDPELTRQVQRLKVLVVVLIATSLSAFVYVALSL
jgi:hypothetical protein